MLEEVATWLAADGETVREATRTAPELAGLGRRAAALRDELAALVDRGRHAAACAGSRPRPRNVSLHASPIDVGPALARAFDLHPGPVVFTSATLTVAGSFDYVRARVGPGATPRRRRATPRRSATTEQALLYLAADLPEPNDDAFRAAAAARAAELCAITGGRALLLFTSFRNLRVAEAYLRAALPSSRCWCRASARGTCCWRRCATAVGSVLLATQSFWEGVDVPGEALSLVVIDRIPFAVPDDPLIAARIDRIREQGGDPFGGLPAAARGAGAQAGLRAAHPQPRRHRHRRACSTDGSRGGTMAPRCWPACRPTARAPNRWRTSPRSGRAHAAPPAAIASCRSADHDAAIVLLCAAAYLGGSIPTGLLVARARGVDLRTVGSGNIGATNVARALGRGWAIAVLVGDALKGFVPVFVGRDTACPSCPPAAVALAGLAAIVGHMFTIFLRGRGGKGVATSLGVALAISPPAALCGFARYVLAYVATRISSVGSLLGMWSFPLFAWLLGGVARPYLALSLGTAALVTIRHRANIAETDARRGKAEQLNWTHAKRRRRSTSVQQTGTPSDHPGRRGAFVAVAVGLGDDLVRGDVDQRAARPAPG